MWVTLAIAVPSLALWLWAAARKSWRGVRQYQDVLRHHQGLCGSCGYDMRRTPARCPECGAVPRWTP